MEKVFNIKILIILFGHLWEVELTYRYIFAFKISLRSQQPDIVSNICCRYRWHRWQICRCRWYWWCTLTCEYLREFSKKFETVLMGYSWAGGKLTHEKNQKQKSRDTVPLKSTFFERRIASLKSKYASLPFIQWNWKAIWSAVSFLPV